MSAMLLKTEDIKLVYGGRDLFSGIGSVCLLQGQHLLVVGSSGCGKTSLLHVLTGILRPSDGRVYFKTQPYDSLKTVEIDALRGSQFGIVLQRIHLLGHLNVYQNVALAFSGAQQKADKDRILAVLDTLGLRSKAYTKAHKLSQGEAQRVAIARAVVHEPAIIFADEPTSALDDQNAENVMKLLFSLADKSGASLVVSTHDHRVRTMFPGNILEMGV